MRLMGIEREWRNDRERKYEQKPLGLMAWLKKQSCGVQKLKVVRAA